MKRILLTSTAIVAFAGAAAAEVGLSGDATVGFNDEFEGGAFIDSNLSVSASAELDNGVVAEATYGFEVVDMGDGGESGETDGVLGTDGSTDFRLSLSSDAGRLIYGDLADDETAQASYFIGVTNDGSVTGFSEYDGETALRGDLYFGDFHAGASMAFDTVRSNSTDADYDMADDNDTRQLGVGAKYESANFRIGFGYQEEETGTGWGESGDFVAEEVLGIGAGFTVSSVDLTANYVEGSDSGSSIGIEAMIPFGDFSATAFYVMNDDDADVIDDNLGVAVGYDNGSAAVNAWFHDGHDAEIGVEGSYALAGGVTLYAGYIQGDDNSTDINSSADSDVTEMYVAGTYDLGGGAEVLVSYGEVGDSYTGALDEIGDGFEVKEGTTIQVSMSF